MANRPQSLSKGQRDEVVRIFHGRLLAYFLTSLAIIGGVLGVGLWQIKQRLESKMESMIADQFKEPRIHQTVSEVAATKAQYILMKQIQPEVDAFKDEIAKKTAKAEEDLANINETVTKANSSLSELKTQSDFFMTALSARNDDRKAFDRLEKWSKDESYRYRVRAEKAWLSILDSHSSVLRFGPGDVPWNEGFDPSKLSLSDLEIQYAAAPDHIKPSLLKYIWGRDDFQKIEKLDFMMGVMKSDSSLNAVEQAGRYFTSGTKQKIKPLAVSHLSDWWDQHRQEFEQNEKGGDQNERAH